MSKKYIQWFEELAIEDIPQVGGKNASLGEMYQLLTPQGIRVPNGFATTSQAYWLMLDQNNALNNLQKALDGLDPNDVNDLAERGAKARDIIYGVGLPNILRQQILSAFHQLKSQYSGKVSVAVRKSQFCRTTRHLS